MMFRTSCYIITWCWLLFLSQGYAQNPIKPSDSLGFQDFVEGMTEQLMLIQAADLQPQFGEAKILEEKGAFDVTLQSDYSQKFYSQTNYYRIFSSGARWQSPWGVRFYAGADWTDGVFLNPERNLPTAGLGYLGIELPLGSGLLYDKYRGDLQQARIMGRQKLQKRWLERNKIFAQTAKLYVRWMQLYELMSLYQNALELAEDRYQFVKNTYEQGDFSAIDTVEAQMQLQQREIQYRKTLLKYREFVGEVNSWWPALNLQNQRPANLYEAAPPVRASEKAQWVNRLQTHPEIEMLRLEAEKIQTQRRVINEAFKPKIDIKYQWLTPLDNFTTEGSPNLSVNDLNWGLSFAYPIPLRAARGKRQYNKIARLENNFRLQQRQNELQAQMRALLEVQDQYEALLEDNVQLVNNFRRMLEAEQYEFDLGESSLFLVNTRESRLINAEVDLVDLKVRTLLNAIKIAEITGRAEEYFDF